MRSSPEPGSMSLGPALSVQLPGLPAFLSAGMMAAVAPGMPAPQLHLLPLCCFAWCRIRLIEPA